MAALATRARARWLTVVVTFRRRRARRALPFLVAEWPGHLDHELREARMSSRAHAHVAAFDNDGFFASLDAVRATRGLTWRRVADEAGVSSSTLTRIGQGRRPDVESFASLVAWAGLRGDDFLGGVRAARSLAPLVEVAASLRADPNLSPEAVAVLEALLVASYESLRRVIADEGG